MAELFVTLAKALGLLGALLLLSAYSVLAERKVSAWIQGRVGPNRVVPAPIASVPFLGSFLRSLGVFQPLADGLKFLFKEEWTSPKVRQPYYTLAPILAAVPALSLMALVPFGVSFSNEGLPRPLILADVEVGILAVFALASLGVYGIVLGGYASNSKYPFLGSIRASAQIISYELVLTLSVLPVFLWSNAPGQLGSLSLFSVARCQEACWLIFFMPVPALTFFVGLLAETNRLPFDMAESETDLVGGFHTEYGAFKFALFFLSEYAHMIVGSALFVLLFLGAWHFVPTFGLLDGAWANPWQSWGPASAWASSLWFLLKVLCVLFIFIWVRWTLPRFRYDQVMRLSWCYLMPLALANVFFYALIIAFLQAKSC